ncbi:TraR/DksA family transcriptional regulator [Mesorhizobium sp. M2E.F.Ca.ET.166.01.1.1]|nr:TraR/DksA family transcriptional regulator [Mesorhizobium sp. M2E.F.Ca.ET.166.01.1.1]TGW02849.1 TraR/DksA family transcriptional regulator [Mesorhizobium sp. M2E.F.Ca.ET.154.01.1.1]
MGQVLSLIQGRHRLRKPLPKPRLCDECDDPIETARLQVQPKAKRCISCEKARERRHKRALAATSDRDIVVIKG